MDTYSGSVIVTYEQCAPAADVVYIHCKNKSNDINVKLAVFHGIYANKLQYTNKFYDFLWMDHKV